MRSRSLHGLSLLCTLLAAAPAPAADPDPFTVRVVDPDRGDLFAGQVILEAEVTPPHGATVKEVQFLVDGSPLSIDSEPPYQAVWAGIDPVRDHLIRVTAVASDGRRAYGLLSIPILGPVERVSVTGRSPDFVLLAVTFLDADGRPLVDVKREEVRVLENGEEQQITVFAPDDRPLAAELLLDASQSTRPQWGNLGRSTALFADTLREGDRAGVMAFNNRLVELAPLGSASAEIERATAEFRDWGGTTRLYDALSRGSLLDLGQEESRRRALVVLTDARDFGSTMEVGDVEDYLSRSEVQVHALILFADLDVSSSQALFARGGLSQLAELTGGSTQSISSLPLVEAFVRLGERLRAQYIVGYNSISRRAPGKPRKVEVQLSRPGDHQVLHRQSHFGAQTLAEYLARKMTRGPERRRRQAVRTAARMSDPVARAAVVSALGQGRDLFAGVSREARIGLLDMGLEALPYLRQGLADDDERIASRSAAVLVDLFARRARTGTADGLAQALRALGDGDAEAGRAALREIDPKVLPDASRARLEEVLGALGR